MYCGFSGLHECGGTSGLKEGWQKMEQIRGYMQLLIWMMLFVVVIEMVFPETDHRKYIKLVLGCILVYTLLKPIIAILPTGGESYEAYIQRYEKQLGISKEKLVGSYEDQVEQQGNSLKEVYAKGMKSVIEKELQIGVKEVQVVCDDKMMMTDIYITVGESENKGIIEIAPIHIGNKSDTVSGDEEKLKNKIKTCLNNFYNVQDCNIYITVQKN